MTWRSAGAGAPEEQHGAAEYDHKRPSRVQAVAGCAQVTWCEQGRSCQGGFSELSRATKTLVDSRDYKFPQIPETCNVIMSGKWRHDSLNLLEAYDRWAHSTIFFHEVRKWTGDITQDIV